MFALAQLTSPCINSIPKFIVAQLSSEPIQQFVETIAVQSAYVHLSYLIFVIAGLLLLSHRMNYMEMGTFKIFFSNSIGPRTLYIYILLFLIAITAALLLARTQPNLPLPPEPKILEGPEELYPKKTCGDDTSQIPPGSKVDMYPIFVDGGDRILQKIRTDFCRDAFRHNQNGMIQVASFIDKDKANDFRSLTETKFGHAEVGAARLRTPNR